MERKTTISVPKAYLTLIEDLRLLKSDEQNPNQTTINQQKQIWSSLKKYGWTYPIITNKEGLYADGEQRADVCKQHGEFYAPVLRLPITDVDRRMLRQILNKLRGKHDKKLDAAEFVRIIQQGQEEDLKAILASVDEKLPEELIEDHFLDSIPGTYEIVVECKDEEDQKNKFEKLKAEGYKLRILTL